jgi:hypothetical protein
MGETHIDIIAKGLGRRDPVVFRLDNGERSRC